MKELTKIQILLKIPFYRKQLLLLLFFIGITNFYGQVKSMGLPEINNHKRTDYQGGTQNWDIDQYK
jgi:hypothetical protein